MKKLVFLLVVALVSFAVATYAGNEEKPKKVIKISLAQAKTDPGLVSDMYAQIDQSFLKIEQPGLYTAVVRHDGKIYIIYGSRNSWLRFFQMQPQTGFVNYHW